MSTTIAPAPQKRKAPGLPARRRFTVAEYYHMAKAGILLPDERIELLDGEIFTMAPMRSPHAACVSLLANWFILGVVGRALVRIQLPIRLDRGSEPEPDLAIVTMRADYYADAHPGPGDVLLIIEVSDTSLAYDRRKLALYAAAGIPEVWIFDLRGKRALVHRDPQGSRYRWIEMIGRGGTVAPLAFPDLALPLDEILPR